MSEVPAVMGTNSIVPVVLEKGGRNHMAHVPVDFEAGGAESKHFPKKMALRRELRPHRTHKDADLAEKFPSLKNSELLVSNEGFL